MALCIALLSPGDMGHSVASVLIKNGVDVITCVAGRSERTKALAEKAGIKIVENDEILVQRASIVLSILVPSRAGEIVDRIIAATKGMDKKPLFADLNAIAPETVKEYALKMNEHNIDFVDGGIMGGPPRGGHQPRIYVSGKRAKEVQALSKFGLDVRYLGEEIGSASGFKMAYAAINKGLLLIGIQSYVAAKELNVEEAFLNEMRESQPELQKILEKLIPTMCPKAYRWVGEMEEIAKTYESFNIPGQNFDGFASVCSMVRDSPLGDEIVEERKRGTDLKDVVDVLVEYNNTKSK